MRIAILIGESSIDSGGSHSYAKLLLDGLLAQDSLENELIYFVGSRRLPDSELRYGGALKTNRILGLFSQFRNIAIKRYFGWVIINMLWIAKLRRYIRAQRLNKSLRRHEIDFVLSLTPLSFPLTTPYAMPIWDLQHRLQPYWPEVSQKGQWVIRESGYSQSIARATRLIVGTQTGAQELASLYGVNSELIIIAPFPVRLRRDMNKSKRDANLIYYPAQFWPHKNHINLLLGFKLALDSTGRDLRLVLPGSDKGNLGFVMSFARKLGIIERVSFPGFISDSELLNLSERATLQVFPSYFGPDNLPPLEALASNCTVAVSNVSGAHDQFGNNVLYFDPDSPQQICDLISKCTSIEYMNPLSQEIRQEFLVSHQPSVTARIILTEISKFGGKRRNWK
jgi:glycosyltransferase involved in cell wall biosynthesis